MREINYKSDFDFILHLKDRNGSEIGVPSCDFTITLWTWNKANVFKASRKGDRLENCFIDGGQIHVVCKNHRMGAGELHAEFHAELPNDIYPEGIQNCYQPGDLGIRLGAGAGEAEGICPQTMSAELKVPVGGKGQGNTGTGRLRFLQNGMISNHAREGVLYRNLGWIKLRQFSHAFEDTDEGKREVLYFDLACLNKTVFKQVFENLAAHSGESVSQIPADSRSVDEIPYGLYVDVRDFEARKVTYTWNKDSRILAMSLTHDGKYSGCPCHFRLRIPRRFGTSQNLPYLMKSNGIISSVFARTYDVVQGSQTKVPDLRSLLSVKLPDPKRTIPLGEFIYENRPDLLGCEIERRRKVYIGYKKTHHYKLDIPYHVWRKIRDIKDCNSSRGVFRIRFRSARKCEEKPWVYFTYNSGKIRLL